MNTRINLLRKTMGLTLEQFGERLGVSKAAVSRWESGDRNLSDQTIFLICKEFHVNHGWIRTGMGEMFDEPVSVKLDELADAHNLKDDQRALVERFIKLSPEARQAVIQYVIDVADQVRSKQIREPEEMSPEELHAELDRHIALEKGEKSGAC